ncbi:hypothetical protein [Jiangella alba]|uniref:Uncharacterized protein n=1 Tax=Jiangella alba TaxID=561176 RepID=A0A1H5PPI6_9ACTN|nr:hypothetical protein [Jiangella alba]SEF15813.1 hypothetical protein SAMN04488561_5087 [Jiangella alba]
MCAVAATTDGVGLSLHKAALLDDPEHLLTGDGQYLRTVPGARAREHTAALAALLRQALERQNDMLPD